MSARRGPTSLAGLLLFGCAAAPPAELATEDDVVALEPAALAGDRAAIRALFAMRPRCDGAVLEIDDMVLGSTIRPWPSLFLQELQRHEQHGRVHLGGILGNNGPELVDEFELQLQESQARIGALQSVDDPGLAALRDRCIAMLRDDVALLTTMVDGNGR